MNRSGQSQRPREFEGEQLGGQPGHRPAMQPDVRQSQETRGYHIIKKRPQGQPQTYNGVTASPITMNDFHGTAKVPAGSGVISLGKTLYPTLAIPQNKRRKKFVILNPDNNASTLYVSYKQSPYSLYTVYVGGSFTEQGNDVSRDDIYVWCDIAQPFGAYEGVRDIADEME